MPSLVSGSPSENEEAGLSRTPSHLKCPLVPEGPLLSWWRKPSHGATGRFVLRQHHLLAILGMTPILSQVTLEYQNSRGSKWQRLSLTLHLEHFIKSLQDIVLYRCYRVPIL